MATIYRKTGKGQAEIDTRVFRLSPRMRAALIMVDGHRSDVELAKLIPGGPAAALQALLADGFIEVVTIVEIRPAQRAPTSPTPAASAAAAAPSPAFERRRRDAVRALNELLGPGAESLAMRIEKAADWGQLLPVLRQAQQALRSTHGTAVAADYGNRFIDMPLG
jgi:hypothetical protein